MREVRGRDGEEDLLVRLPPKRGRLVRRRVRERRLETRLRVVRGGLFRQRVRVQRVRGQRVRLRRVRVQFVELQLRLELVVFEFVVLEFVVLAVGTDQVFVFVFVHSRLMAILDGRALGKRIRQGLKVETAAFIESSGVRPCLATVLVGGDPASAVYVRSKRRACERLGYESRHHEPPRDISQEDLLALVNGLNADPAVHGILVQLPLPGHLDSAPIIDAIDPDKDVDGFHTESVGRLALKKQGFVSCTPKGILRLLQESGLDPSGKRAVVVGRSAIVGMPVSLLLTHANATVTVCHSRTPRTDLEKLVREADILVVAIGRPEFIPGDWVKPGAVVIDVGVNDVGERADGKRKLVGDVEFGPAADLASWITPVPGGVGPMTIAMLMENTLLAAKQAT
jgi:methylenetetrahydrofolate dehydrogenase (NADP+)/methenyltetrahydrofolate cyclohydrolase